MHNVVYGKAMENLRSRVDERLVNKKKTLWNGCQRILKPSFVTQNIFDNDLVVTRKIKTTLTLMKSAYIRMLILALSEVQYINFIAIKSKTTMGTNWDYYSQKLPAWCTKLKVKMALTILVRIKKCLI